MRRPGSGIAIVALACCVGGGCAMTQEQQQQMWGTLGGAATGALIGGIAGGGRGAAIGAASGALVGWSVVKIAQYNARRTSSANEEYQYYGYEPSQGTIVKLSGASVGPDRVRRGDLVNLEMDYAVLAPSKTAPVVVDETWELWKDGALLTKTPARAVRREPGGWETTASIPVPADADPGTYVVKHRVEAGTSYDVRETAFVVA